jgi:hypothetical protein
MAKKAPPVETTSETNVADVSKLSRSEVRYAIFRHRSGNAEAEHEHVYAYYAEKLKPYDLDFTSFTIEWDVSPTDNTVIVSGLDLKPLQAKVEDSLFNEDGSLKDPE